MTRGICPPFRQFFSLFVPPILGIGFLLTLSPALHADNSEPFPDPLAITLKAEKPVLLHKTGESARKAFIFPLYRIAHYTDLYSGHGNILDYQGPKAVQMIFQREIDGQRIQQEVKKAIRERVSPQDWELIKESATAFCQPYATGKVSEGDMYSVVWYPEGLLVSEFNGKEIGRLMDENFARALWSIWLGQQSLVNTHDLLGEWDTKS